MTKLDIETDGEKMTFKKNHVSCYSILSIDMIASDLLIDDEKKYDDQIRFLTQLYFILISVHRTHTHTLMHKDIYLREYFLYSYTHTHTYICISIYI